MPTINDTADIKILPIDSIRFQAGALGADLDVKFQNVGDDSAVTHVEAIYRAQDTPGSTLVGFKLSGSVICLMNNYEDLAEALNDLLTVQPDNITIGLKANAGQGGGGEMYNVWSNGALTVLVGVGLSGFAVEQAPEFPRLKVDFVGYALRPALDPGVATMFQQISGWS